MPQLVALDLVGPALVTALRTVWDRGDAALPLDPRLPATAVDRLLGAMAPASVIGGDGEERPRAGGRPVEPGDALVMATSGSTGEPKGVVLTHAALAAHARGVHARLGVDRARDRWLACLPLAHMGGLGVVVRALVDGVPLDVLPAFDAETVARAPHDLGSTLTSLVPATLDRLPLDHGFRWVVLGGSGDRIERPPTVVHTYGLTETGGGIWYSPPGGLLAGAELRIVAGEIEAGGPTLLRAYRDGTDPRDDEGWLPTGDLGEWGDDGQLIVHGRRGDLIVTGGENVWPTAVEEALLSHPAVAEVAVVGRPDPAWGQRVEAHVVLSPAAAAEGDEPALDELRDWVKQTLPAFAAPRALVVRPDLPRTALGKVRRDQL